MDEAAMDAGTRDLQPPEASALVASSPPADVEGPAAASGKATTAAEDDPGTADWNSLYCIYMAVLADSIAGGIIVPYSAVWTKEVFKMDNVGLYSGLLVGISSFAAALSSPLLGWVSDVIGRRGLILMGLSAVAIFNLVGAFVMSYWVALLMHGVAGFLDSTQSVAYAAIGDLTTGAQRQSAFGYSAAAGAARILAVALGGYTYGIEPDTMRVVFKDMPGHGDPLLSHLVASGLCVAAAVFFLFFYTDSSPAALRRATQEQGNQAQAPTQGQEQAVAMGTEVGEGLEEGERRLSGAAPTTATEQQPLSRAGTAPGFIGGLRYVAGNRMLVIFIGCYAYTSPLSGMTLMAIPLLSSDQNKGLHMNTFETGMVLLLFMAFYVLYNQLFFRRVVRRIGQKSANTAGLILVALGILGFPLVEAVVPCHTPLMWVVLTVFCAVSGIGYMMVNTIFASVISSHADANMQGVAQGVSKMLASLTRGLGPMILGPIFEWAVTDLRVPFVAFLIISLGYLSVLLVVVPIARPIFEKKPAPKKV